MAKLYFRPSNSEENLVVPSKRTIDFLLNYSKSLKVLEFQNLKFETILN